jgi:PAS domain S-box-containing protein
VRALVASADPDERAALREELARHGHDVAIATDSHQALAQAADAELAVVACRLGRDSGVELCRALRSANDELVAVVVGPEDAIDVAAALAAGAADVWPLRPGAQHGIPVRVALAEHYARLQVENLRLGGEFALMRQALDLTGTGFVLTDPRLEDNPIVYANASFYEMTGFRREEVLGRNCRFLQGEGTEPERVDALRRAIAEERPVAVELLNRRRDGTAFRNEVHVAPVRDASGEVVRFVGVQVDVTPVRRQQALYARETLAREEAERAQERSAFLARASPLLDASLDLRATLDALARLSVPMLGDVCLVDVIESGEVRRAAYAAADPVLERLLRDLPVTYAMAEGDPVGRVLRSRRAEIIHGEAASVFGGWAGALGERAPRNAMLVPLRARGRAIGVLAIGSADPARLYDDEDLGLAEDLAGRAGLALDNARLFERQAGVARVLQESLLPDHLPTAEGLELGAAYRPAGDGTEVGGDFYDAFRGADGSLTLAIGDVSGKGAKAAALTGLTRHTLRTAAQYEHGPTDILGALNRALVAQRSVRGKYCTVALCRFGTPAEDGTVRMDVASAGHPLPLVLRRDGRVEPIGEAGTLLGYVVDPTLHESPATLERGDAVVLYTDGITEAKTRTGLLGDDRLASLLRACAGLGAQAIAERLERATVHSQDAPPRDDVAIAVARVA